MTSVRELGFEFLADCSFVADHTTVQPLNQEQELINFLADACERQRFICVPHPHILPRLMPNFPITYGIVLSVLTRLANWIFTCMREPDPATEDLIIESAKLVEREIQRRCEPSKLRRHSTHRGVETADVSQIACTFVTVPQSLRDENPAIHINCQWCGESLSYIGSGDGEPAERHSVHVYGCETHGRIYLTRSGFTRRRPGGWGAP